LRPRKEEVSKEVIDLLTKAKNMEKRIDEIQKSQPGFSVSFKTEPHHVGFESESGGRTRSAYYNTNNHLLESKDVKNAGATKSSVNIDSMSRELNTHDANTGHESFEGGDAPKLD
tara:strand:+ start:2939 stop:3283 length:345 start_codon:yes stop_codon:yes gene_type:complete